jgi:hypothetical protein
LCALLALAGCHFSLTGVSVDAAVEPGDLAAPWLTDGGNGELGAPDLAPDLSGGADLRGLPDMVDSCPTGGSEPMGPTLAVRCVSDNAITVDGDLSEWTGTFAPLTHATAGRASMGWMPNETMNDANSSALLALRWDRSFLYIGIKVTDDVREDGATPILYQNDALEVYLDGKHDRTIVYDTDDHIFIVREDNQNEQYQGAIGPTALPAGVVTATKEDAGSANWTMEMRVPWSVLGSPTLALGAQVGFDLQLDDNDQGNPMRDRWLLLFANASNVGGCSAAYCSTTVFGAAQLTSR